MNAAAPADQGPLCDGLAWNEWHQIISRGRQVGLQAKQSLCGHLEPEPHVLVLMSGRVRLSVLCAENGTEQAFGLRNAPAIIEYDEAELPGRRSRHVEAESACKFLAYGHPEFASLLTAFPRFAANVAVALLGERRLLLDFISGQLTTAAIGRMARYVLSRLNEGEASQGARLAELRVTQDDLAIHAGVSRVWVNRILRSLADQSIVECSRGRIIVRDRGALNRLAFGIPGDVREGQP